MVFKISLKANLKLHYDEKNSTHLNHFYYCCIIS